MGVPFFIRGTADGWSEPVFLRDRNGDHLETGRFWNPDTRAHIDGKAPEGGTADRAYAAVAVDWDNDGDYDLLRGTSKGLFYLRRNDGKPGGHSFALQTETLGFRLPPEENYAMPVTADWDGDGLWDIICGSRSGRVFWFRNSGSKEVPKFPSLPEQLVGDSESEGLGRGSHAQVEVCDWDGDGDLDLLVGDCHLKYDRDKKEWDNHGYIWLYRREGQSD